MDRAEAWEGAAAANYGVLSRRELLRLGLSRKAIASLRGRGAINRVAPSVYVAAAAPESFRQRVVAACAWGEGATFAFRRTAAALFRLDGFGPHHLEVVTLRAARPPEMAGATFHRTRYLPEQDTSFVQGVPTTTPARTLLDLGGIADERKVARAVEDALGRNLVTVERLLDEIRRAGRMGRSGTAPLRRVLEGFALAGTLPESELEKLMLEAIARSGLPEPVRQFEIRDRTTFVARVDAAYPELRIALEADGYEFHSALPDWQRDLRRQNALIGLGWLVLRFTRADVRDPRSFIRAVRQARASRAAP